ncbi:hypothetical protein COCON_G00002600 [Conger conger]|uniref:Reverse transcriptase n=1 Tax=Conger conger TaxID=82655 RepID=A0A9Q1E100_CONCO|nr:hypothetical protein COCON_G00002600 [Conger conger]
MDNHHLKLNPGKTEMIFIPANTSPHLDLSISLGDTTLTPSPSARNLGVVMDSRLSLSENIAAVTRSCRFFLYNIRRIRPFLTPYSTQLLVQAMVLSHLDYCNSLLAGLPASAIRPLQLIQNAAARLVFNLPKYSHVTPLLTTLHWLPVMARIKFKTLVLAFQAVKGSSPAYLQKNHQTLHPCQTSSFSLHRPLGTSPSPNLHLTLTTAVCSGSTVVERTPR